VPSDARRKAAGVEEFQLLGTLAQIAGVFVGFGALISVRRGNLTRPIELTFIRGVVWTGLLVIVAALLPVALDPFIDRLALWRLCGFLTLAVYWGMVVINNLTREQRRLTAAYRRRHLIGLLIVSILLDVPMTVALGVLALGLRPDLEAALYTIGIVSILFEASFYLLYLVYAQKPR
jgi:hypothetical protein